MTFAKRFCPKCMSKNVRRDMTTLTGALGAMADWFCEDCGFKTAEFPIEEEKDE